MTTLARMMLVVMTAVLAACTQGGDNPGTPAGAPQTLTVKGYKIANPDDFGAAVALPTVQDSAPPAKGVHKVEGSVAVDVGVSAPASSGGGASSAASSSASSAPSASSPATPSKPSSVKFNDDGTFKISYSDNSYLVGQWKMADTQLQLIFGGEAAFFDTKFPDADSIELWIKKTTGQASGEVSSTAGGASYTSDAPALMGADVQYGLEPKALDEFLAKTKGTWCYASGNTNIDDDAIASFVQQGQEDIHVLLFFSGSDYEKASLYEVSKDLSFGMSYYHAKSNLMAKFSVDGDVMTVKYAPFKKTLLKKISDDEAQCPNLPKVTEEKTPEKITDEAKIFAKAKGTWCFDSGFVSMDDNTVASIRFKDEHSFDILLFPKITTGTGYYVVSGVKWYPDDSFELNHYTPFSDKDKKDSLTVDGDVMTVHYVSGKTAKLKRVSSGITLCPDLKKFIPAKKLAIATGFACVDSGKTVTLTTDTGVALTAVPDGTERFVVYLGPSSYFGMDGKNGKVTFAPGAYVCTEKDNKGSMINEATLTSSGKNGVKTNRSGCFYGPYAGNDPVFNSDVIIIYPYENGKNMNLSKDDIPAPTCKKP